MVQVETFVILRHCVGKNDSVFVKINIPRHSRGFFIDGHSPLLPAARVTSRWYGSPAAKDYCLPPVNGLSQ